MARDCYTVNCILGMAEKYIVLQFSEDEAGMFVHLAILHSMVNNNKIRMPASASLEKK